MASSIICIGALLVDELFFCTGEAMAATSNPATLKRYAGGVAGNIAHHLALLDVPVQLVTVVGNDSDGDWLINECAKKGIGTEAVLRVHDSTGKYASILNPDGSLFVAACTDPCGKYLSSLFLEQYETFLSSAKIIIADTNIPAETIQWLSSFCKAKNILLLVEPVSVSKAKKLAGTDCSGIFMVTPNEDELISLCNSGPGNTNEAISELLARAIQKVWVRKGSAGSEIFDRNGSLSLHAPEIIIKDSTGAGDAALAGWAAAYYWGMNEEQCLKAGHALALEILQAAGAVSATITKEKLLNAIKKYYPDEK